MPNAHVGANIRLLDDDDHDEDDGDGDDDDDDDDEGDQHCLTGS